jgi:hypothetical protein
MINLNALKSRITCPGIMPSVLILVVAIGCDEDPDSTVERRRTQRSSDGTAEVERDDATAVRDDAGTRASLDRFIELLKTDDRQGVDQEAQITFRAMVKDVAIWSAHGNRVPGIPVGIDLDWLLTVQLHSADAPISALSRGTIVRFLIHSPKKVFGLDRPAGMRFKFTMTYRSETDSIAILSLRADSVETDGTPRVGT